MSDNFIASVLAKPSNGGVKKRNYSGFSATLNKAVNTTGIDDPSILELYDLQTFAATVSLSVSPVAGLYERGLDSAVINDVSLTATATQGVGGTNPITSLELRKNASNLHTFSSPVFGANNYTETGANLSVTTTYSAIVTDAIGSNTATATYTFVYPFIYDYSAVATTNQQVYDDAQTNGTKLVKTQSNTNITNTYASEIITFAYPSSYGALSVIFDQNDFDVTSAFAVSVGNVVADDLSVVSYRFYRLSLPIAGTQTFKFNF